MSKIRGRHGGGWKKRGEENLTNDILPKKCFFGISHPVRFPPLSASLLYFHVQKGNTDQTRRSFRGVQKLSGGCIVRSVSPPIRITPSPPCHGQTKAISKVRRRQGLHQTRSSPLFMSQVSCHYWNYLKCIQSNLVPLPAADEQLFTKPRSRRKIKLNFEALSWFFLKEKVQNSYEPGVLINSLD